VRSIFSIVHQHIAVHFLIEKLLIQDQEDSAFQELTEFPDHDDDLEETGYLNQGDFTSDPKVLASIENDMSLIKRIYCSDPCTDYFIQR
jgi:hypothetical protein